MTEQGRKTSEAVSEIAAERGVSTAAISRARMPRRSPPMLPIPGAGSVAHREENVGENIGAAGFHLADAEFAELNAVAPRPYWPRA